MRSPSAFSVGVTGGTHNIRTPPSIDWTTHVKIKNSLRIGALAAVALVGLTGCATNETPETGTPETESPSTSLSGSLVGAGASSQGEAQNSWIASFLDVQPDITINYDPAGSGTGRENFQQGAAQFAGSDRAFKLEEITDGSFATCAADSGLVELPLYISPIAIIFNIDGVDSLNLDAESLAKIFTGEITKWNDPVIAAQNAETELPDLAITPVHRSDKSGTTGNFTDYLGAAAADVWTYGSVEEWPIDGGEAAAQTSGVVSAVEGGNGMIGYADASRAGGLGTVNVKVGDEYVPYSPEAAAAVVDASPLEEGRTSADLAIALDRNTDAAGVYPIVLISYLIGCETYEDSAVAPLVKEYFTYAASEAGQKIAADNAGSAPISSEMRTQIEAAIATIK